MFGTFFLFSISYMGYIIPTPFDEVTIIFQRWFFIHQPAIIVVKSVHSHIMVITPLSLYIYITPRTRTMVLYNIWLYIYHISIYLSLYIYTYIYIIYPLKFTGIFSTALPNGESVVWCKRWFRFAQIPMASDGSVTCRTGGSLWTEVIA